MWVCPKCKREFKKINQSHYCGEAPKTIEEWIIQQEQPVQDYFQKLHHVISNVIPDMKQRIAWSMPTYGDKQIVVQFSACKNHASLYVGEKAIEHFSRFIRCLFRKLRERSLKRFKGRHRLQAV